MPKHKSSAYSVGPKDEVEMLWALPLPDLHRLLAKQSITYLSVDSRRTLIWKYLSIVRPEARTQIHILLDALERGGFDPGSFQRAPWSPTNAEQLPDHYATLGVPKSASGSSVRQAYKQLAMKCHPDKCPGDAEAETRFKALGRAYEVLADPAQRQPYDAALARQKAALQAERLRPPASAPLKHCESPSFRNIWLEQHRADSPHASGPISPCTSPWYRSTATPRKGKSSSTPPRTPSAAHTEQVPTPKSLNDFDTQRTTLVLSMTRTSIVSPVSPGRRALQRAPSTAASEESGPPQDPEKSDEAADTHTFTRRRPLSSGVKRPVPWREAVQPADGVALSPCGLRRPLPPPPPPTAAAAAKAQPDPPFEKEQSAISADDTPDSPSEPRPGPESHSALPAVQPPCDAAEPPLPAPSLPIRFRAFLQRCRLVGATA